MIGNINKKLFKFFFNSSYRGTPAWEIGHPQPEIVLLEKRNEIRGSVLDLGCGTGENTLFLAQGHEEIIGVDYSTRAIELAMKKGEVEGSKAHFQVLDALEIGSLGRRFDTIIDSTLLPNIAKRDRGKYLDAVKRALSPDGAFLLLIFRCERSSRTPPYWMTKDEISGLLASDWMINFIREGTIELERHPKHFPAWVISASPIRAWP